MNMNSCWHPQRSPFLLVFINTSVPIDGRTEAVDKGCIYCTNRAPSGSTLTHSSVCVRTKGDPFQLFCAGVCQQCSWRQSSLWRPVLRIDTALRSACSQGTTWALMNNGERIFRAKEELACPMALCVNCDFKCQQVKLGSLLVVLAPNWIWCERYKIIEITISKTIMFSVLRICSD